MNRGAFKRNDNAQQDMKTYLISVVIVLVFSRSLISQSVIDSDGNSYPVIRMGKQFWLGTNLKTTKFNDGSSIPLVTEDSKWRYLDSPSYCWLNNDENNKEIYGALYNWYAVDTKKLCPKGWHVPSNTDWNLLTAFLGSADFAGARLKEKGGEHWKGTLMDSSDEFGFTALPAGFRNSAGIFPSFANSYTVWWSSTKYGKDGCNRGLYFSNNILYQSHENCRSGFSVRCIKDE